MNIRDGKDPERLESMYAHKGKCLHCGNIVKIYVNEKTNRPDPLMCCCIRCGQRYYMEIEDMDKWLCEQWQQKESGE